MIAGVRDPELRDKLLAEAPAKSIDEIRAASRASKGEEGTKRLTMTLPEAKANAIDEVLTEVVDSRLAGDKDQALNQVCQDWIMWHGVRASPEKVLTWLKESYDIDFTTMMTFVARIYGVKVDVREHHD